MINKGFIGANYGILYHLLSSSEEDKLILEHKLKKYDEKKYNEFVQWKDEIIKIWKEEGKTIPPWK